VYLNLGPHRITVTSGPPSDDPPPDPGTGPTPPVRIELRFAGDLVALQAAVDEQVQLALDEGRDIALHVVTE
jgi:hypothetical protein